MRPTRGENAPLREEEQTTLTALKAGEVGEIAPTDCELECKPAPREPWKGWLALLAMVGTITIMGPMFKLVTVHPLVRSSCPLLLRLL